MKRIWILNERSRACILRIDALVKDAGKGEPTEKRG